MSNSFELVPDAPYLTTVYSDGSKTTVDRISALRFVALYGRPAIPWRPATDEEVEALFEEAARLAKLSGRYG